MTFVPYDRPVRAAFVGLGRIYDLNMRAYVDNPDVEVVALVDPSEERRAQRQADWPEARRSPRRPSWPPAASRSTPSRRCCPSRCTSTGSSSCSATAGTSTCKSRCATTWPAPQRMLEAARANDRQLRVMENYIFYEPLRKLKETVESGEHRRGERLPHEDGGQRPRRMGRARRAATSGSSSRCATGRGILVFDDGWHKLATALWLFGPIREVRAWIGGTEVVPGIEIDAPTTIVWEHENGIRGVWDITLAPDMYLRSDYYTNDERWEVTGRRGYARVNRCTGRGIQQPSLEVYADGEMRVVPRPRRRLGQQLPRSGRHWLRWLHTGEGPLLWSGDEAVDVLRFALAAYASSAAGGIGIDPASLE